MRELRHLTGRDAKRGIQLIIGSRVRLSAMDEERKFPGDAKNGGDEFPA